jgi:hypothetical protein
MKRSLVLAILLAVSFGAFAQKQPAITQLLPALSASSGGAAVSILGRDLMTDVQCFLPCPTTVTFGNVTVPLKAESDTRLLVIAPAHAPGVVQLVVNVAGKTVDPIPFTFTPDDDDAYAVGLVPVHVDGILHGAFGAQWKTELWLRNSGRTNVEIAPWPCGDAVCSSDFPRKTELGPGRSLKNLPPLDSAADGNPSRLVYIPRNDAANVSFSLRFADVSRASLDGGVELPVIREQELLGDTAQLFNVPLGRSFRVMLRLYELSYTSSRFLVKVYPQSESDEASVHSLELTATAAQGGTFRPKAAYVQFDITSLLGEQKAWPETARIEVTPLTPGSNFWAFASITNNDTQIVTLVTPQ